MGIYLDKSSILDLVSFRNKIFEEHAKAYQKYNIDILSNDILSSLSMWEIISQYDQDYEPNFHRNGEDGRSKDVLIERKCSTVKPTKTKNTVGNSGWQFHAQETQKCARYIFAVRRKDNLKIVRIYDIVSKSAIQTVRDCLDNGREQWIKKGKPNHDAIVVPEKLLLTLPKQEVLNIDGCVVVKL